MLGKLTIERAPIRSISPINRSTSVTVCNVGEDDDVELAVLESRQPWLRSA